MEYGGENHNSKCQPTCHTSSCQYWLGATVFSGCVFLAQQEHRLLCPRTSHIQACPVDAPLWHGWCLSTLGAGCGKQFLLTSRSGSGVFSAMTWDLLRLQSFLLNLLIRFSLSSLRDRSSTLAPDDALRSRSGSRTDLSARNKDKKNPTLIQQQLTFAPEGLRVMTSQPHRDPNVTLKV